MRLHDYAPRPAHLKWLLDSDPAIRWQVMMFKIMLEKHDPGGDGTTPIASDHLQIVNVGVVIAPSGSCEKFNIAPIRRTLGLVLAQCSSSA
jgi:hypothetical protein